MTTKMKSKEFMELTPEEKAMVEKECQNLFKSSYSIEYTQKKLNNRHGFGKINAFVDGNRLNPKLVSDGKDPNSLYYKKNQAILSQSKTGITTYQYDYCGMKPKKKTRTKPKV